MKGPATHAHSEASVIAVVATGVAVGVVAILHPFGVTGSTPLLGLPWWVWLLVASYAVAYPWRRRAWR